MYVVPQANPFFDRPLFDDQRLLPGVIRPRRGTQTHRPHQHEHYQRKEATAVRRSVLPIPFRDVQWNGCGSPVELTVNREVLWDGREQVGRPCNVVDGSAVDGQFLVVEGGHWGCGEEIESVGRVQRAKI